MIKVGHTKNAKYWGEYKVKKIAKLAKPVICHSQEKGEVEFMPAYSGPIRPVILIQNGH